MSTKSSTPTSSKKLAVIGVPEINLTKNLPQGHVISIGVPEGTCALTREEQRRLLNAAVKQFNSFY